jgi:hypothetical protein|tara:strand:+ start:803 stop:1261 length:459 start_codon:yes stop_codon:yes gene_type:complete
MLKDRHIDQNTDQIIDHLKQNALADIVPKIYWERNNLVKDNPDIPASHIISKSKTSDFPAEAITVRTQSQRRKVAMVYFYGEATTRTYGKNHTWTSVDEQLRVTLPMKGYNKKDYSYHFQGQLPNIFDMQDLCWALDYIKEQFDTMTGGKTA